MSSIAKEIVGEFFDREFYIASNADVAQAGVDPLDHYLSSGAREGRSPAPWFDVAGQRAAAGLSPAEDPFLHLITSDVARARELQGLYGKDSRPTPAKAKAVMQPFYALAQQAGGDSPIVFTAVAGTRHAMPNNTTIWPDMRVFGDTPITLDRWRFHPSLHWDPNPKITALFHKYCLLSLFPAGTKLIWVDSRVSVQRDVLTQIAERLDEADICAFAHYERSCVYDELVAVLKAGRASLAEVQEFERALHAADFPENAGLYETGILGMKAGDATNRVLRRTFGLARRYIARDQVVLPLALRDSSLKLTLFNEGSTNLRNTPGVFVHRW